jgi:hypothetical protein
MTKNSPCQAFFEDFSRFFVSGLNLGSIKRAFQIVQKISEPWWIEDQNIDEKNSRQW